MLRDDSHALPVTTTARLLRDQGYAATGRAQLLAESGVSNGSPDHHFPGGMEKLAPAAPETSGQVVADVLRDALDGTTSTDLGICEFLDIAKGPAEGEERPRCSIAPTPLETSIAGPRLRSAAARCLDHRETLIAARLRSDGWPEGSLPEAASAVLVLVDDTLLLARVSGELRQLESAKRAVPALLGGSSRASGRRRFGSTPNTPRSARATR